MRRQLKESFGANFYLFAVVSIIFAAGVLTTSIFRSVGPKYNFSSQVKTETPAVFETNVSYELAHPGILPNHPLWPLKAWRDKVWLFLTTDSARKAELHLLFADKRISAARSLFEQGEIELSILTAQKAEIYLGEATTQAELAFEKGLLSQEVLKRIGMAALKHKEVLEELRAIAPDDARPYLTKSINKTSMVFDTVVTLLAREGINLLPESKESGGRKGQ